MTTNRLAAPTGSADKCPPDMPRGDSPEDKAARVRFWIERGNARLIELGKGHLHWRHSNGNYWIEDRRYSQGN